ncbi:MAG TPA: PAS domain S-box protein, partial [Deltaproteobacteria bacterium]|nr:PAS domain S-box protein [Deltaproteobacteria bacterium]
SGDACFAVDRSLVVVAVSPANKTPIAATIADLEGRRLDAAGVIHPDDVGRALRDIEALLAGGGICGAVYRFFCRDGPLCAGEVWGFPFMEGGRVACGLCVVRCVSVTDHTRSGRKQRLKDIVAPLEAGGIEERVYRFMVEESLEEVYLVDDDAVVVYANAQAASSLGYTPNEMMSMQVADFDPVYGPRFREVFEEARRGRSMFETVHVTRQGSYLDKEIACRYLVIDGQEYICGFGRDVTQKKKVERELRESEKRFRDLVENTSDLIWETDEELRFSFISRTEERHLGYAPGDMIGKTLLDFVPPDQAPAVESTLRDLKENPRPFTNLVYTALHKDGSLHIRQTSGVPVYDDHGRFAGYRGVTRDITEQKRVEELLVASEKKYSAVFGASPVPLVLSRFSDGLLLDWNASFERWSGHTREDLAGRTSTEVGLWEDPCDRGRLVGELAEAHCLDSWETIFRLRDNTVRDVVLASCLIELEGEGVMLTQIQDVTDRKRIEDELRRSRQAFLVAFHESPAPMVITRLADGVVLDANRACLSWSGFERDEVVGASTVGLGFWTDSAARTAFMERVRSHGRIDSEETTYRVRDGSLRQVIHSARLLDLFGVPCILSHILDVTEARRASLSLRESEALLRGIVDNFPGAVFRFYVKDQGERGLHYLSASTLDVLGIPNEREGFLEHVLECLHPEDRCRFEASVEEAVRTMSAWDFTTRFKRPSGEWIVVRGISRPERLEGEVVFSGVILDVTEQHRLSEELASHRDHLEETVRERTKELTDALARLTSEIETRKKTESMLRYREMEIENRRLELEEMNAALRVLIKQREEDKATMEENIKGNIRTFVLPHVERMESSGLTGGPRQSLEMIRSYLMDITSSFGRRVSSETLGLTPVEIQVASLIRQGKTSKEIARILNVSLNTVQTHRYHIRKKGRLGNKKVNLRTYLKGLERKD